MEEEEEEEEKIVHMSESKGHRPLWGRCPAPPSTSTTTYLSRAQVPLTIYCFCDYFVCTCYSHTNAFKLGLPWTMIDMYWQNFIVLTLRSGDKVNLHFTRTSTKNKNLKSV